MSDNEISRRGVMGVLAAASVGKMSSVSGADGIDAGQDDVTTESDHLPDYANRAGRIGIDGLNQAIDDWGNGVISSTERDEVIEAWNLGTRVVDKTVIQWDSNISDPTTWETDPNDEGLNESVVYQITSDIGVNAQLTIEPGVVIEFQQGTSLNVNSGPILAQADGAEEIFMTATVARRGWWDGVYVPSEDLQNTLENVRIEYAGRQNYRGCLEIGGGNIAVTGCTLRYSGEYGMYQTSGGTLTDTGNNVYANNREAGVRTTTSNMHQLSASSEYNDNDRNYVFVQSNTASDAGADEETRNWENLEEPYRMQGNHRINNLTLTVDPGTKFEFTQQSSLEFEGGARIDIQGEDGNPIVFSAPTEKRGWWNGVYLDDTTDSENHFNHCVFEYAANNWSAALDLGSSNDNASAELTNCTFRRNDGYGLVVGSGGELTNCENNTYTENTDAPVWMGTDNMQSLSSTSDFTGNDNDYVLVKDWGIGGGGRDSDQREWDNINVPYRLDGYHNVNGIELSIAPGATLEFTEGAGLEFEGDTRLSISGLIPETEEVEEITFTGTKKQRGWWNGIYLDDTTDQENSLEHVVVEYAGKNGNAGIRIGTQNDDGYLQYTDCTFRNCSTYGVEVGSGNNIIENLARNTYTGNGEAALRIGTKNMEALSSTSDFTGNVDEDGNSVDHVLVASRGINGDGSDDEREWSAINVPYRLNGYHNINNIDLTVKPGVTLEFTEQAGLEFEDGADFHFLGEQGNEITLTGTDETRGWWNGVYIDDSESRTNRFEYTIFEYAGDGSAQLDLGTSNDSAEIEEISNCTFRHGDTYGIEWGDNSRVRKMSNNTYTNHAQGAVLTRTENMHELNGNSDFTGNDKDRVEVKTSTVQFGDEVIDPPAVWDNLNVPWVMQGGEHRVGDVKLTIKPGTRLEFKQEGELEFEQDSEVNITGTSDNKIVMTATQDGRDADIKGWWYGIYIDDTTNKLNKIEHSTVEYAGRDISPAVDIGSENDSGYLEVRDSTIRKSEGDGIYADNSTDTNSDVCSVNTFEDNNGEDCNVNN